MYVSPEIEQLGFLHVVHGLDGGKVVHDQTLGDPKLLHPRLHLHERRFLLTPPLLPSDGPPGHVAVGESARGRRLGSDGVVAGYGLLGVELQFAFESQRAEEEGHDQQVEFHA